MKAEIPSGTASQLNNFDSIDMFDLFVYHLFYLCGILEGDPSIDNAVGLQDVTRKELLDCLYSFRLP